MTENCKNCEYFQSAMGRGLCELMFEGYEVSIEDFMSHFHSGRACGHYKRSEHNEEI